MFIDPGTNNISRDNVAKHITSGEHKAANHLRLKWKLRNEDYQERVVMESPNAKCFVKLSDEEREQNFVWKSMQFITE